ncbi:MAG: hypothetical protein ABIJ12_10910 [bacterium]
MQHIKILLHPLFILSLLILILNDHFLKANYPSFLTGKLSDFAGLFLITIFMFAIAASIFKQKSHLLYLHIAIALLFTLWKLAPVEKILIWLNEISSIPMPSRVKDPTDLIALVILLFSFMFLTSRLKITFNINLGLYKKILATLVLLVSGWSILATSKGVDYIDPDYDGYFTCCKGMRGNIDGSVEHDFSTNDIVYLAEYLYRNGSRPPCLEEADVNASGDKNPIREDDLDYLIAFLFEGGPPPCDCPRYAGYDD